MLVTVTTELVIRASPGQVFKRLCAVERWPEWGSNLVSMKMISDGPLRAGSRLQQVAKNGRNPTTSVLEVTAFDPDQSFGIKGPNLEGAFTLEALGADTRLRARFTVEARGLAAVLYRLMLQRYVETDLRTLRTLVESGQG
jgi:hypothetical protein